MRRSVLVSVLLLSAGCAANDPSLRTSANNRPGVVTSDVQFDSDMQTGAADLDRTSHRVGASAERVWSALPEVYQQLGIQVDTRDAATRTLGNGKIVLSGKLGGKPVSTFLNCGMAEMGGFAANEYRVTMSVSSLVKPQGAEEAELQTLVEGSAVNHRSTQSRAPRPCTSTGELERLIVSLVRGHAGA